jgi:hypothetical protein
MSTFRFSSPYQVDKSLGSCRFQSCRNGFLGSWSAMVPSHSPFTFMNARSHILGNCNISPPTVRQCRQLYDIDAECSISPSPNVAYHLRLLYNIDAGCSISPTPTPTVRYCRLLYDIDAECSISSSPIVAHRLRLLYVIPSSTTVQPIGFRFLASNIPDMPELVPVATPPLAEGSAKQHNRTKKQHLLAGLFISRVHQSRSARPQLIPPTNRLLQRAMYQTTYANQPSAFPSTTNHASCLMDHSKGRSMVSTRSA